MLQLLLLGSSYLLQGNQGSNQQSYLTGGSGTRWVACGASLFMLIDMGQSTTASMKTVTDLSQQPVFLSRRG